MSEKIVNINELHEFKDNPYQVKDNEDKPDIKPDEPKEDTKEDVEYVSTQQVSLKDSKERAVTFNVAPKNVSSLSSINSHA